MNTNVSDDTNIIVEDDLTYLYDFFLNYSGLIIYLIFDIPSILMHLIVFGLIFFNKTLRSAANNYIIFFILCCSFGIVSIAIPFYIDACRSDPIIHVTNLFCNISMLIESLCYCLIYFFIAWASFERHLLIFHASVFNIKWKNVCFHYMPPIFIIIYMVAFYIYAIFIYPCENPMDIETNKCTFSCYLSDPFLGMWDMCFHGIVPTISILLCNCTLLFRVYRSKIRLRQSMDWRKYRIMIFQLVSIASLYLLINIPYTVVTILSIVAWTPLIGGLARTFGNLLSFIPFFLPFVYITSIPELKSKLKRIFNLQASDRIGPVTLQMRTRSIRPIVN
ncbi:hypothetical protein I4U23_000302 [Adineta vaga]|nr:hypothetical protein I4U23_000302 [Adineta vaga]